MNATEVFDALQRRHRLPEWVLIRELRLGTGFGYLGKIDDYDKSYWPRNKALQRIDAYALNCYTGQDYKKIAYEIKVSRGDFLHEKKHPEKREAAIAVSDYFYFVAPRGLIAPMEIPKDCGLLAVYDSGRSEILKMAPRHEPTRLDWRFVASLTRNALRTEPPEEYY